MKNELTPLISVIIPAYNAEKSIARAVNSVMCQTYSSLELIVINDCSTDGTRLILDKLRGKNSKFSIIDQSHNKGASTSRNEGIKVSNGKWLTFLDADDHFKSDYLQNITYFLNNVEFICTSYYEKKVNGSITKKTHNITDNTFFTDPILLDYLENYYLRPYSYTAFVHCWNKFFLKDLLDKNSIRFDRNLHQLEDVDFVSKYLRCTKKHMYVDVPGIFHNVNFLGSSLSTKSGLEKDGLRKLEIALEAPLALKKDLLHKCGRDEKASFQHFFCSMIVLFCIRISRQFWKIPTLSSIGKIYGWLSHPKTRQSVQEFQAIEGESKAFFISFRYLHPIISTAVLLLIKR